MFGWFLLHIDHFRVWESVSNLYFLCPLHGFASPSLGAGSLLARTPVLILMMGTHVGWLLVCYTHTYIRLIPPFSCLLSGICPLFPLRARYLLFLQPR